MTSRRHFIALLPASLLAGVTSVRRGYPARGPLDHPTPRPGITAAKVLTRDQLGDHADVAPVFDMVRQIPEVVDGIRCQCGCAGSKDFYSLLSCFEGEDAMARHCAVCQGEARLAHRMHKQGKSLDAIRKGVDGRYG